MTTTRFALLLAVCVIVACGFAIITGQPQEDTFLFNCHAHGDHECGPDEPWHGFVNW